MTDTAPDIIFGTSIGVGSALLAVAVVLAV